jgi:Mg2+-importing ATPase
MFSLAGASLFTPFLPLLPKQILLVNLLTDLPEMTIATDEVDDEWTRQPRRWDLKFIRRFMLTFGLLSALFDFITFAVLLRVLGSNPEQFRSGWFIESVVSASLVVLVIRTPRPLTRSFPGRWLLISTLLVACTALLLPFTPLAKPLGFTPLPVSVALLMLLIVVAYVTAAEWAKRVFYRRLATG